MKSLWSIAAIVSALTLSSCAEFRAPVQCQFYAETHTLTYDQVLVAAREGDGDAQYALGYMYWYGYGVERNPCAAKYWIDQATNKGHGQAIRAEQLLNCIEQRRENCRLAKQRRFLRPALVVPVVPFAPASRTFSSSEQYLLKQPNDHYTLQLLSTTDEAHMKSFIRENKLSGKTSVYNTHKNGDHYFVVIYGDYRTADEARAAIRTLPLNVQQHHPRLQQLHGIKHAINRPYHPRAAVTFPQKMAKTYRPIVRKTPSQQQIVPRKFSSNDSQPETKLAKKEPVKTTVALSAHQ